MTQWWVSPRGCRLEARQTSNRRIAGLIVGDLPRESCPEASPTHPHMSDRQSTQQKIHTKGGEKKKTKCSRNVPELAQKKLSMHPRVPPHLPLPTTYTPLMAQGLMTQCHSRILLPLCLHVLYRSIPFGMGQCHKPTTKNSE